MSVKSWCLGSQLKGYNPVQIPVVFNSQIDLKALYNGVPAFLSLVYASHLLCAFSVMQQEEKPINHTTKLCRTPVKL